MTGRERGQRKMGPCIERRGKRVDEGWMRYLGGSVNYLGFNIEGLLVGQVGWNVCIQLVVRWVLATGWVEPEVDDLIGPRYIKLNENFSRPSGSENDEKELEASF